MPRVGGLGCGIDLLETRCLGYIVLKFFRAIRDQVMTLGK